jgi:hypothetical protein
VLDVDLRGASDDEIAERIDAHLAEHPWSSTKAVETAVLGSSNRKRELLKSGRYVSKPGNRGATLYALALAKSTDLAESLGGEVATLPGIPHE